MADPAEQWFLVACLDCSPLLEMPFTSAAERGRWAAQHKASTGHGDWLVADSRERMAALLAERTDPTTPQVSAEDRQKLTTLLYDVDLAYAGDANPQELADAVIDARWRPAPAPQEWVNSADRLKSGQCPRDGAPLAAIHGRINSGRVFVHRDGTSHGDMLAELTRLAAVDGTADSPEANRYVHTRGPQEGQPVEDYEAKLKADRDAATKLLEDGLVLRVRDGKGTKKQIVDEAVVQIAQVLAQRDHARIERDEARAEIERLNADLARPDSSLGIAAQESAERQARIDKTLWVVDKLATDAKRRRDTDAVRDFEAITETLSAACTGGYGCASSEHIEGCLSGDRLSGATPAPQAQAEGEQ